MLDHHFENLGADRFQQLVQAILKSAFPRTTCYPIGQPDGGRDAIDLASDEDDFIVYQIKFSKAPRDIDNVTNWLLEKVAGEKEKIEKLVARGAKEYILVTNVAGTSHLDVGTIDRTLSSLKSELDIPVRCWWRDDLNRRLDSEWNIKLRYPEVLSGHDFFHLLLDTSKGQDQARRSNALRSFLTDQYEEDVDVKFKQIELHNKLLDLFIDLPFRLTIKSPSAIPGAGYRRRVVDRNTLHIESDPDEEDSGTASLLLSYSSLPEMNQIVIEGAPGQGKSTLAQYLCQVHRIRMLQKDLDLERLPQTHRNAPVKIPFKVDLRDVGAWLVGIDPFASDSRSVRTEHPRSLEAFLAKLVGHHSGGIDFGVNDLLEISKITPLLLVLDGLDEVVDIKQRAEVVSAVTKAAPRLREICPAISIIITTRPAAFANSPGFDVQHFPHLQLRSVSRLQINGYAERWMNVRRLSSKERSEFTSILSEKLDAPHLRDLARNPMQLAILLSLVLTQGSALPDKRTNLYDAYVDLFFSREASKSSAVRKHIELLKELHGFLGWSIHSRAETERRVSSGRISNSDLRAMLSFYLAEEDHGTDVIEEVFNAMLERVVMIVSRIQGTYEFEVQPLREYFAARYLYDTASYSPPGREKKGTKPDRFDAIARNFYWLNVVRFFCGCFSKGELLDLADRVKDLIVDPILGKSRHPVTLAAMLLSDWVFAQSPKATAQLVEPLVTINSFRRLSPKLASYRSAEAISLPERSGGSALFNKGFELLERSAFGDDLLRQIASVVIQQSDRNQLVDRWCKSNLTGDQLKRWLFIGLATEALSEAPKDAILERIGGAFSLDTVTVLMEAGRYDCILASEPHGELLKNAYLSQPDPSTGGRVLGDWPFYFVPMLVGDNTELEIALNRSNIIDASHQFMQIDPSTIGAPKFVQECYQISCEFLSLIEELRPRQLSKRFEDLFERCINLWGARPAVVRGIISFVDRRRVAPSSSPFEFFDPAHSLVRRLRAAKARRNDIEWWQRQLSRGIGSKEKNILLLAYYREASADVLVECFSPANELLESLSEKDWVNFRELFLSLFSYKSPDHSTSTVESIGDSRRARCLLAIRSNTGASYIVRFGNEESAGDEVCGPELAQGWTVNALLERKLEWPIGVAWISRMYSAGASSGLDFRFHYGSMKIPPAISDEILSNPLGYPHALWEQAERSATETAAKAIKAVGSVAKADQWFAG